MKSQKRINGSIILLMVVVSFFILIRLPTTLLAPGGQDEEWYGIPGLTIATEGIPRVPYSRATEEGSVFLGADEMLFAQPPLSFYAQAPFFKVFAGDYGTARLASMAAAIASILLTYGIAQAFFQDRRISIVASALYSASRLCFFPAMVARPDMICGMLGLASVWCVAIGRHRSRLRWFVGAGVAVGMAALSHPFAIVFGIQLAFWIAFGHASLAIRMQRFLAFALSTAMTFALWTPLIVMRPDLFRAQFIANILRPAGPGLLTRFAMPWESLSHQMPQLVDRAHPIQFAMMAIGMIAIVIVGWRTRERATATLAMLAWSSVYLLAACLGNHPIQGFWCYSGSLAWIAVAFTAIRFDACCIQGRRGAKWIRVVTASAIAAMMVPGAGVRTVVTYADKFGDNVYSNPSFVRTVLADLPPDASLSVGPEFALPAYAAGRQVILACRHPMYFDSTKYPTDFYVLGRRDFADHMARAYECEFVRSYGNRDDIFANYAEVYRRVISNANDDESP